MILCDKCFKAHPKGFVCNAKQPDKEQCQRQEEAVLNHPLIDFDRVFNKIFKTT